MPSVPRQTESMPLAGYYEIAAWAGVKRPVVSTWRKRHPDFPQPVAELTTGPVWWWPDVAYWLDLTGREYDTSRSPDDMPREQKPPNRR